MKRFLVGCVIAVALTGCASASEETVDNTEMSVEEVVSISESNDVEEESNEAVKNSGNEEVDKTAMEYDEVTNSFEPLEEIVIDDATESLFRTVGNTLYVESADIQNYIIVSQYGENYDDAELIGDKRLLTSELEYFYSEVMGENRSFASGQAHSNELAVECRNDGYCYTYNGGVGTMGYFGVKNITVDKDMCHVEVGYYDDLDNEINSISFNMKKADNKYGYTLVRQ